VAEGWGLERGVGAIKQAMKQDIIAKDATRNCGVEGGWLMKYCMDCQFFRGNITVEDREFLVKLLRSYDSRLMIYSWTELGQTKIPSGRSENTLKARAADILKRKGYCLKERIHVYFLEPACAFWQLRIAELQGKGC